MEQQDQAQPGALENDRARETPAGDTANFPEGTAATAPEAVAAAPAPEAPAPTAPETQTAAPAAPHQGEPTLAEHIQAHADAVDETINGLSEKATALRADIESLPAPYRQLPTNQVAAIEGEIDRLKAKKISILAMLHELPAEIHSLEARVFAALKHLF